MIDRLEERLEALVKARSSLIFARNILDEEGIHLSGTLEEQITAIQTSMLNTTTSLIFEKARRSPRENR
jgi:hypothetical protein